MHGAVDLDEVVAALRRRQHRERRVADGELALEAPGALGLDVDGLAVQLHVVAPAAGLGDPQPVGLAAHPHVDLVPRLVPDLGTAALGGGEEALALAGHVRVLRLDGGREQGDVECAGAGA